MATAKVDGATAGSPGERLRAELQPRRLVPALISGVLNGALEVALAVSFAALVFSGDLSPYLARGIGLALFSATVGVVIVTLLSSLSVSISASQSVPAAIVALAATAVAAAVAPEAQFATVAVVIALTTLAAGLVFLFLGHFRLTGLVRFLPYPVIGGFLARTGWLLLIGGVGIMAGRPFTFAGLGDLLAAVGISAIALLLNATGLELSLRRDLDLNREMRSAGWANLVAGLGGGFVGTTR